MKQFSAKLFFALSLVFFISSCSDPVKVGDEMAEITINAAWIADNMDEDTDGYSSLAKIYFEVTTTQDVDVTFILRHKSSGGGSYAFYKETALYSLTGTSTLNIPLGNSGYELTQGCYDFSIEVYFEGDLMTSVTASEEAAISDFCMERPDQEQAVVGFNGAWIADYDDQDGDNYYSFANIYFELTTSKETNVTFVIKYKVAGNSTYSTYKQTAQNTISGTSTWYVALGNSGFELPHNCYDFAIEVYSSSMLLAAITAQQQGSIGQFCMETPDEELASVTINDTWIADHYDLDQNGYYSLANLYFELTTSQAVDVYFVIKYKLSNESTYSVYKQSSQINISGTSSWYFALGNSGFELSQGCYDFSIEVYTSSTLLASVNGQQDNSIASFCMETPQQDYITLKLNNTVYTEMEITVAGYGTQYVNPGASALYNFSQYPGSVEIQAYTSGRTSSDTQIGVELGWGFSVNMSADYETDLIVGTDFFFMRMRNAGAVDFSPIYVNYGLADETIDNIIIPANNVNYNTGYYAANPNTEVRAYYYDNSGTYIYWFPASLYSGENNQLVELWWEPGTFGKEGHAENPQLNSMPEQLAKPSFEIQQPHKKKYINPQYGVARR